MENNREKLYNSALAVKSAIYKVFDKKYYNAEILYNGNAIEVQSLSPNSTTRIWIRLGITSFGYTVNMSSIELSTRIRHKGKFTQLMKEIAKLDEVDSLMVGGVCTQAMLNWCIKNSFKSLNGSDYILTNKYKPEGINHGSSII